MNLFECKIRYEKMTESGVEKMVTEQYLVDALSFTEAEARMIEEMTPFISGEFTITDIKRTSYSEIYFNDDETADTWFKCKLVFITLDEHSGVEKSTAMMVLVLSKDLKGAIKTIDEKMSESMVSYRQLEIKETSLVDVFQYKK